MRTLLLVAAACISAAALAQDPAPDSAEQVDDVKSLTERDLRQLRSGRGMGAGRVAELNGYPGPLHVLELAAELELTEEQVEQTQLAFAEMSTAAIATGAEIIEAERRLDEVFAAHDAEPESVQTALTQIGVMRARLRYVHVEAHMRMRDVLSEEQIEKYGLLRAESRGQGQGHGQGQRHGQGHGQHRQQAGQD